MPRPKTDRQPFYDIVANQYPSKLKPGELITRKEIYSLIERGLLTEGQCRWIWNDPAHETSQRGTYRMYASGETPKASTVVSTPTEPTLPPVDLSAFAGKPVDPQNITTAQMNRGTSAIDRAISLIPKENQQFVAFGCYDDLKEIIASKVFFPVYITGLSGNGKTEAVNQACAVLGREIFRVNITAETDEFDLLGGFCLENGSTVFHYGPVVEAMKRGAVLLLDEIDLGTPKIMALQSILEGKGVYLKKVNEWIMPAPGFNIIATANTKGQGHESGKFHGTGFLNEAFLDRFPATIEQDYPATPIERRILSGYMKAKGLSTPMDKEFSEILVDWAKQIRETFIASGGTGEVITTRRLITAITSYAIFNRNRKKAVEMACARFPAIDRDSFVSLYDKLDETVSKARMEAEEAARIAKDKELHPEKYASVADPSTIPYFNNNNYSTDQVKAAEILKKFTMDIQTPKP